MRISDWSSDVCSSDLVTFVVPFSPGGSNDIVGRQLATQLSELWGQPVVVENRPGAGATVGSAPVAAQPADGYRSEEHTSELQSLMRISYAVFCLKKKKK